MKLSEQIRAAAKRLTPETWIKDTYFKAINGVLCMCAHGAMQAECNPSIKREISNIAKQAPSPASLHAAVLSFPRSSAVSAAKSANFANLGDRFWVWKCRPSWIRDTDPKYGNLDAHYLLGLVGLTASLNDDSSTTLEQVLEKFEEAAKLAESFGV